MELDKRIAKDKTYIDCFETELAKKFIGKECYLSNDVTSFANINNLYKAVLKEVDEEAVNPYTLENTRWRHSSNFILPCEWVKPEEPEKKYRSYKNVQELFEDIGVFIGDTIHFRSKAKGTESHSLITSYTTLKDGTEKICLGGAFYYTMQALFDLFELHSRGEWQPFGVIDDDVSEIIRDVEKAVDKAGEL